jgi:hydroxymethylpyrimidine pyrophosphatase-like HAD family hydrolase
VKLDRSLLSRTQWFLDFDGSLCPHLEVWEERTYDPQKIYQLVKKLHERSRGIVWNTGRRPESLASVHPGFLEFPGYFIHGSVRWDPKAQKSEFLSPKIPDEVGQHFEQILKSHPKLRLEKKPTALRVAPFDPVALPQLTHFVDSSDYVAPQGWDWYLGARGAELLPKGFDKRTALKHELKGDSIPVAIGDDHFDGPAFQEALIRGGFAMLVGENCGFVTQMKQQAWQTIYCDDSASVMRKISRLLP